MPHDCAGGFAPSQIYIWLGITIATFAWLVKADDLWELKSWQAVSCGLVMFHQVVHLNTYRLLQGADPIANGIMHGISVAAYLFVAAVLFASRYCEVKSRSPDLPPSSE